MHDFAEEIHIVHIQCHNFADPHSGAVQRFKYRSVSGTEPGINGRRFQQSLYLFVFEELGQLFLLLGGSNHCYGI